MIHESLSDLGPKHNTGIYVLLPSVSERVFEVTFHHLLLPGRQGSRQDVFDDRNHVRRQFFVLHIKPFLMQDRKAVDGFIVLNHSRSVEA